MSKRYEIPATEREFAIAEHALAGACKEAAMSGEKFGRFGNLSDEAIYEKGKAEGARAEREAFFGVDRSWPLADVLEKLASAAEHLLCDHDCDREGHEEVKSAAERAREFAKVIRDHLREVTP